MNAEAPRNVLAPRERRPGPARTARRENRAEVTAAKAVIGSLVAFVGALGTASLTGGIGLHEWLAATLAGLGALSTVYVTPNRSKS